MHTRPQKLYDAGTFGHYLQNDLKIPAGPTRLPLAVRNIALRLQRSAEGVAPNSPMLPGLAKYLGVPLDTVQKFAKGAPLNEKWLSKISTQLARGTIPRGKKLGKAIHAKHASKKKTKGRAPVEIQPHTKHELTRIAAEKGFRLGDLAKELGVKAGSLWAIATGKCAPSHPLLPEIANALDIPLRRLQAMCKLPGLSIGRPKAKRKEKVLAVVHVSREHTHQHNGNGHPKNNGHHPRKYNAMRKQEIELRQAARSILSSLNLAIMEGQQWSPPLPVAALHAVMQDYMNSKGGRGGALVLDPRFAEFFDPK